jgi:hypothetical protein
MHIEGECHCGAIAFEAEIDPDTVSICHCSDCQQFSGAPYRASVPAKAENLKFTRGVPKVYVKTADSGNKRAQGFCGDCGSAIYSAPGEGPQNFFMLRLGGVKQRAALAPKSQIWTRSALPWTAHIAELKGFPQQAPAPEKK